MHSANHPFSKAGFGQGRQTTSARSSVTGRRGLDSVVCYAAAGAAILFLAAVVLGLVGH
ncbi:hypothetical protein C7449_10668 [Mycoplana dimorpha]|uniref:Uncharacterized protein n=1 Tax=Mycoplana dimorpha TaxID=28320 RepID=A0A2T5B333_MYCDI|nr:hypothetical protein C7449_10668 [Mycoplana dimorpha]